MAFDKIVIKSLTETTKSGLKMDKAIDFLKEKLIDAVSSQIEKQIPIPLPFNIREVLSNDGESLPTNILSPSTISNLPEIPDTQKEQINNTLNQIEGILNLVIQQKNTIQSSLSVIQQPLNSLEKLSDTLGGIVTGLRVTVNTIKLLPIPTSVPPGIGIPLNVINGFSDTLITLQKVLDKIGGPIEIIPSVIRQINEILAEVLIKLSSFDRIFGIIMNVLALIRTLLNYGPNATQDQLNQTRQDISSTTQQSLSASAGSIVSNSNEDINKEADRILLAQLEPNSINPLFYKDFKLEIQYNTDNNFSFPSRRIKGKNINDNQILYNENDGNYSFSSSTQVLLDEIKFRIDQSKK
jgi:hypothetical protein